MSHDQVERYTRILEQIESANVAFEAAKEEWREYDAKVGRATFDMHPAKVKSLNAYGDWNVAKNARLAMIEEITHVIGENARACDALGKMAIAALEELVCAGTMPSNSGGAQKYWRLIYGRILSKFAEELKSNPVFGHVRIMDFLTKRFVNRLPEFAEEARKGGNPMLAQTMERLATERNIEQVMEPTNPPREGDLFELYGRAYKPGMTVEQVVDEIKKLCPSWFEANPYAQWAMEALLTEIVPEWCQGLY